MEMKNKNLGIIFFLLVAACGVSIYLYSSSAPENNLTPAKTVIPPTKYGGIQTSIISPLDPRLRGDDNGRYEMANDPVTKKILNNNSSQKTIQPNNQLTIQPNSPTTEIKSETPSTPTTPNIIQIPVTLKILDKNYETTTAENSTVYELMKKSMNNGQIQFSTQEYSSLGHFVEEINGVKNNKQAGIYWLYYINDQSATVGISNYHLKSNDIISWKYDKAQF